MKQSHEKTEEKSVSLKRRWLLWIGLPAWVLVGFIAAAIIIGLVYEIAIQTGLLNSAAINESIINTVIAALVYVLTLVIVIGVPLKARGIKTSKAELGLTRWPSWTDIVFAPMGFLLYLIAAGILLAAVTAIFPGFDADEAQEVGFDGISHIYEYVLAFLTLVVVAPLAEEVLVRGYLYGKLRKVTSVVGAVVITSLLFSLMHFQWNVALNVLPLGIILALLRESTGSIWASVLLHMVKNGVAFYVLFVNPNVLNGLGG